MFPASVIQIVEAGRDDPALGAQVGLADHPVDVEGNEEAGLVEPDLHRLASPWHSDADLGRPIEVVADMSKSRRLGFTGYRATDDSFFDLFERLRADRIIP